MALTPEQEQYLLSNLSQHDKWRVKYGLLKLEDVKTQYENPQEVGPPEPTSRGLETFASDMYEQGAAGLKEGTAATLELPTNLVNMANTINPIANIAWLVTGEQPLMQQPEVVAGTAEQLRINAQEDLKANLSPEEQAYRAKLAAVLAPKEGRGILGEMGDTAKFFYENPGAIPGELAKITGQAVAPGAIVPGSTPLTVAAQAFQAAGMNANQVREELIKQGATPKEAEAAATFAFTVSAGVNAILPNTVEGGTAVEGLLAGQLTRKAGAGAAKTVAKAVGGETLTEGAAEALDTVTSNIATGKPALEGVGSSLVMGATLGAPMGGVAGGANALFGKEEKKSGPKDLPGLAAEINDLLPKTQDPVVNEGMETAKAIYENEAKIMEVPERGGQTQRTIYNGLVANEQLGDIPLSRTRKMQLWDQAAQQMGVKADGVTVVNGVPVETAEEKKAREMEVGFREIEAQREREKQDANRSPVLDTGPAITSTDPVVNREIEEARAEDPRGILRQPVTPVVAEPLPAAPEVPATPEFNVKSPTQPGTVTIDGVAVQPAAKPVPKGPTPNAKAGDTEFVATGTTELKATTAPAPVTLTPLAKPVTPAELAKANRQIAQADKAAATKAANKDSAARMAAIRAVRRENPNASEEEIQRLATARISELNAKPAKDATDKSQVPTDADVSFDEDTGFIRMGKRASEIWREDENIRSAITAEVNKPEGGSVRGVLDAVAKSEKANPFERSLAAKLATASEALGIKLVKGTKRETRSGKGVVLGAYDKATNSVELMTASPETALHEIFHGVTKAVLNSREARAGNPRAEAAYAELTELMGKYNIAVKQRKGHINRRGPFAEGAINHAATTIDEFVTMAFTNRDVQKFMASLPSENQQKFLHNFLNAIKKLLNLGNVSNTMLERVLESGAELIEHVEKNPEQIKKVQKKYAEQGKAPVDEQVHNVGGVEVDDETPLIGEEIEEQLKSRADLAQRVENVRERIVKIAAKFDHDFDAIRKAAYAGDKEALRFVDLGGVHASLENQLEAANDDLQFNLARLRIKADPKDKYASHTYTDLVPLEKREQEHVDAFDAAEKFAREQRRAAGEGAVKNQGIFDLENQLDANTSGTAAGPVNTKRFMDDTDHLEADLSPALMKWFGDSKIVNEDGSPKVVYHGTIVDFDRFDTTRAFQQLGSHFGETPFAANLITETNTKALGSIAARHKMENSAKPQVMPVYLRIENPLSLKDRGSWNQEVVTQLAELGLIDAAEAKRLTRTVNQLLAQDDSRGANKLLQDKIKALGYDGVRYLNVYETDEARDLEKLPQLVKDAAALSDEEFRKKYPSVVDAYIVFDPNQVKSASGNRGTYSRTDNRVDHQEGSVDGFEPTKEYTPEGRWTAVGRRIRERLTQAFTPTAGLGEALKEISDHSLSLMSQYNLIGQNLFRNLQAEIEATGGKNGAGAKLLRDIEDTNDRNLRASKLAALRRTHPKLHAAYLDGRDQIRQLSGIILNDLSTRWPENKRTESQKKIINSIIENMDTYYTRVYAANIARAGEEWRKSLLEDFNKYRKARDGNKSSREKVMQRTAKNFEKVKAALNFIVENHLMIPPADVMIDMDRDNVLALARTWGVSTDNDLDVIIDELDAMAERINGDKNRLGNRAMEEVQRLLSNDPEDSSPIRSYYRGGKQDNTIISERQRVPPVLRELLGEFEDPGYRLMSTVSAQGAWVARSRMLDEILERGLGTWVIKPEEKGKPGNESFAVELSGEAYGALQGMYATRAVADMITDNLATFYTLDQAARMADKLPTALSETVVAKAFRAYSKGALWIKATDIMTQASNYVFNYSSGPMLMASNGNSDLSTVKRAHAVMTQLIGGQYRRKLSADALEVVRAGVVDSGYIGELQDTQLEKMLEVLVAEERDFDSWLNEKYAVGAKAFSKGVTMGKDTYAMMDVVWKIANYYDRKNKLEAAYKADGITRTPEQLEREAAQIANLTNIGYKRVMPAVKVLERSGFTRFLPYMTDVFRVAVMNYVVGASDLKRARSAKTPEAKAMWQSMARRRLSGNLLVTALVPIAVTALVNSYEGEDDDDLKVLKGDFSKNKDLIHIGVDEKGRPLDFEISRVDPFEPLTGLWRMGLDKGGDLETGDLTEYALGLLISNPIGRGIKDVVTNDPVSAYPRLRDSHPQVYEVFAELIDAVPYMDETRTAKALRLLESIVPSVFKAKMGDELLGWDSMAAVTGLDLVRTDPERAARAAIYEQRDIREGTQKNFNAWVDRINTVNEEALQAQVRGLMMEEFEAYMKLREVYRGLKTYNLPEAAIKDMLGDSYADVSQGNFKVEFTTQKKLENAMNREARRLGIKDASTPEGKALLAKYQRVKDLLPAAYENGADQLRQTLEGR